MNISENIIKRPVNRRSFVRNGLTVAGAGLLADAGSSHGRRELPYFHGTFQGSATRFLQAPAAAGQRSRRRPPRSLVGVDSNLSPRLSGRSGRQRKTGHSGSAWALFSPATAFPFRFG